MQEMQEKAKVASVIYTDAKTLKSIDDSVLQDAFNINDDEVLQNIKVFEDGITIDPAELNIEID